MREKLEAQFVKFFRRAIAEYRQELNRDLSGPQVQILELLEWYGPSNVSHLAERLYVTCGAVTLLADKMQKAGYLTRERSEQDRRVVMVSLTEKGRELLTEAREIRARLFTRYFGRLTADELNDLANLFNKMEHYIEGEDHGRVR
ncbi:MarR family winged helix-turn-helix transcriptional regulator [Tumebacillus algifaecis]|uniref:MarR family winged helix-turn-helix transcriptional regulator n=1 Tax=Tumebacillus algifaecis TaxID=1214604 RepID=UPI0012FE234E|nr:MarR family transcriptional regulator [Tumebacillus algifaecis]